MRNPQSYYFAARYSRHPELRDYRDKLRGAIPAAHVTSRWIDPMSGDEEDCSTEVLASEPDRIWKYAEADCADIAAAETFVSFTGPVGRGGRHIEHGYAMALGKRIVIVGPRENVFHAQPDVEVFESWPDFLVAEAAHSSSVTATPPSSSEGGADRG